MIDRPRLLVTRRLPEAVEARLKSRFEVTLNLEDLPLDRAALAEALCEHDALCPTITDGLDAELLRIPDRRVCLLANFGAGIEHIDLEAARAAGIAVTNTPDALTDATAEIALLLMLMAARRAGEAERELRAGSWTGWKPTHLLGQGLAGRTLGLVGFGRIARAMAARAAALGMRIRYVSRSHAPPEVEARLSATRVHSIDVLAEEADILSLHVPGGTATRHLVNAALLARMKPHAIVINTARGSVIDEAALADALARGDIAAAGLDVYEREPLVHPALLDLENVVLLPHLGSATHEARTAMGMQAADNLEAFSADRICPIVSPDPLVVQAFEQSIHARLSQRKHRPLVVGLSGAQGSGKSTLASSLAGTLEAGGLRVAILSLDDLYLTKAERASRAALLHPLLATRGVPGTHDVALGLRILRELDSGRAVDLPRFDKGRDERLPVEHWAHAPAGLEILLFEGWCVGARMQAPGALAQACNALERDEDPDGIWRNLVNRALAGAYRALFARIDILALLAASDLSVVREWRIEQEQSLHARPSSDAPARMNNAQIDRFIQHFERLTRHILLEMPRRADLLIKLDSRRAPVRIVRRD